MAQESDKPGFDTLTDLLTHFPDLRCEWLMRGQGPIFRASEALTSAEATLPALIPTPVPSVAAPPVATPSVANGYPSIALVTRVAQPAYCQHGGEAAFVRSLPQFTLPHFPTGAWRAFEVEGDAMQPTLRHADTVVATRADALLPRAVYVAVLPGDVWVKRLVSADKDWLEWSHDNGFYPPTRLARGVPAELWHVRGILTTQVPANAASDQTRLLTALETLARAAQPEPGRG